MDVLRDRLDFAIDLVKRAGQLALTMRADLAPIEAKSALDFCTDADRAVERLISSALTERFGEGVLGEEYGGEGGDTLWVVDPIDGTAGYIHGNGRWCISLAYLAAGTIEIGVIYAPVEDRLFIARRGQGATLNGQAMTVSHLRHGAAPVIEAGWSERRPLSRYCRLLQAMAERGLEFRRHGSGALGLADVACGRNDGYVELHINSWDCLAGLLLVTEAGGVINDFLKDDGLTQGNLILAATPEVMPALEAAVAESLDHD